MLGFSETARARASSSSSREGGEGKEGGEGGGENKRVIVACLWAGGAARFFLPLLLPFFLSLLFPFFIM